MATPEHDRENRRAGIGVGGPTDYERLVRFVLSSGGEFGLAVARATDPGVREGVMTQAILDAEAAGVRVATLDLDSFPADGDLLDALKAAAVGDGGAPLGAVFATNAEALLLDTVGRPRITPAIEGLNRRRDLLPRELPVRLVLWLSDAAADAFAELARDLRDVALTFFRFESREWPRAITRHADLPGWMYLADADEAPRLRREASLLSQMLERTPKEPQAMAEAAARIGQIHVLLGLPDEGLGWLRRAVESFRTAADQRGEATARIRLADVLRVRGQVEDSLSELGEAAKIFESLGEDRSRAITQGQIADILQARGAARRGVAHSPGGGVADPRASW
jgi:tetratricopeptide (TPR) repeat protein